MGVNHSIFRVKPEFLKRSKDEMFMTLDESVILPFGTQIEVISKLSAGPGIVHDNDRSFDQFESYGCIDLPYGYPAPSVDSVNGVVYQLWKNPVEHVSTRKAFLEDFWPLIHCFQDWRFLMIYNSQECKLVEDLDFTYEEWMEMNRRPQFWIKKSE
ncbi:MAG: hypothetical protein AAF685_17190 [Cyanobacteria bacterium P01_C01_bin.89]